MTWLASQTRYALPVLATCGLYESGTIDTKDFTAFLNAWNGERE